MRDLPHHQPVRPGPPGTVAVQASSAGRAGKVDGFHYSAGFAKADFAWDDARLDAWIDQSAGR